MSNEEERDISTADGVTYYWCVNCGNHGMFQIPKFVGASCQECRYGRVTPFSKSEILEDSHLAFKFKGYFENTSVSGS